MYLTYELIVHPVTIMKIPSNIKNKCLKNWLKNIQKPKSINNRGNFKYMLFLHTYGSKYII